MVRAAAWEKRKMMGRWMEEAKVIARGRHQGVGPFQEKIVDKELKEKLLHNIDILDRKEEIIDLSPEEFSSRRILR
ncbi:hypothetical protein COCNU_13G000280 [Cocos nucifera]|uniref:Uncharacterized protein n=1 Tax=Cocos nucifera TaxID=13894 RepID=A0A8K0ISP2_COCNU|nr:hypothetical protein COCNU_13G000280 [Cocos nucifera]